MENTDHTFLVGKGAERQAKLAGNNNWTLMIYPYRLHLFFPFLALNLETVSQP